MSGGPGAGPWPRLRDELRLFPGPTTRHGAPTWTLHDPAGQRFFRLGWMEMEILRRWAIGSAEGIARSLATETTIAPPPDLVMGMHSFLVGNNLVEAPFREDTARLLRQKRSRKKSLLSTLLHNYLFLRIPLLKPDAFLAATLGLVRWMFSPAFFVLLCLAAAVGLFLVAREWSRFTDNLSSLFTLQGGLLAAAALGLSKCLHEFGHAYAAKFLGLKVPSMGVALMCFAPVLWTDTTEAWKLPRRRDRLLVGVSGVMAELILATAASLLWPLLPEGPLKTAAFMLAGSVWVLTLFVNINPCMRYDGYYLLADYWDIPGLQTRAFALAKWWLREQLFGFGNPPPEAFGRWDRTKLIVYSFATWIYRLFLFLGIALMVYYLFFKALGLVLMVVELVFFIALPVVNEAAHWFGSRKKMRLNLRLLRTLALFAGLAAFFVLPWHGRVGGAAVLTDARRAVFYAQMGAEVEEIRAAEGMRAEEGELLFRLQSPDLDSKIEIARRRLTAQRTKLDLGSLDMELRVEMAAEWEQLERLAEDLAGLLREKAQLEVRAPFAGVVVEVPPWLAAGSWVAAKEPLAYMVSGEREVQVFVQEYDRERLRAGGDGLFYPRGGAGEPVRLRVEKIEGHSVGDINYPEIASVHGGPLGAHKDGQGRLRPDRSVYRVLCGVEDGSGTQVLIGEASLEAEPRSLAAEAWRKFLGLVVRESGV